MKVIIKYKTEMGRNTKYRAGSLQDIPEAEAQELIKAGKAIPYHGAGTAMERETRVAVAREPAKPAINSKRELKQAKVRREAEAAAVEVKVEAETVETKVEPVKQEGSKDGAKKDNRPQRKSNK
jgi:hypothetical protein